MNAVTNRVLRSPWTTCGIYIFAHTEASGDEMVADEGAYSSGADVLEEALFKLKDVLESTHLPKTVFDNLLTVETLIEQVLNGNPPLLRARGVGAGIAQGPIMDRIVDLHNADLRSADQRNENEDTQILDWLDQETKKRCLGTQPRYAPGCYGNDPRREEPPPYVHLHRMGLGFVANPEGGAYEHDSFRDAARAAMRADPEHEGKQ